VLKKSFVVYYERDYSQRIWLSNKKVETMLFLTNMLTIFEALLQKSDYLTQSDKMQQPDSLIFSLDTYDSTKGELLDFLTKPNSNKILY